MRDSFKRQVDRDPDRDGRKITSDLWYERRDKGMGTGMITLGSVRIPVLQLHSITTDLNVTAAAAEAVLVTALCERYVPSAKTDDPPEAAGVEVAATATEPSSEGEVYRGNGLRPLEIVVKDDTSWRYVDTSVS